MSLISVNNLTFCYETNYENIFENTSFDIDTDWKLGFIGRNGRGKTTFLQLLMGKYKCKGTITSSVQFDYFPFKVVNEYNTLEVVKNIIAPFAEWEYEMNECIAENTEKSINRYGELLDLFISHDGYIIEEFIEKEIRKLDVSLDVLTRPFISLSNGERTKLMLAALFLKKNNFLLIDEPTNHLDFEGRKCVGKYLSSKKGFILVSHDRYFLDNIVDHIISINRNSIDVQKGNFSSWQDNKNRQDNFEIKQNEKLRKDIVQLEESFRRTAGWSDKIEKSKIGEHAPDRGNIGHKAAKMMKRAKSNELRKKNLIDDKKKFLKDIEKNDALKIHPLKYSKSTLINIDNLSVYYDNRIIFEDVSFAVNQGDRIALRGKNGCGKSSIIKLLIGENISFSGNINIGSELKISYISQDTSFLSGTFKDYSQKENIDETLFRAILSKLDFSSNIFDKDLKDLSGGQKKKVLIAKSLSQIAHVYIWDEPLNFIDVLSRMQIEQLIKSYEPTMIFVEHDYMFNESIATKVINL
ncbi:lincosamide and streptogramin A transport system ATP-binding/permease protein [Sedimentibacter acidaminivorans]|uniref:Lincosamide and streptogramin A transport system ATP-binding/permease protein n=1 Tax=Sedimentibacter acidaminivorans TaxID=913099 RepID=A0ABS4GDS0_9FIRM|nr:ABC-F type ribosomal protection protein [Sedimentibacter acidaminivorans]MBP1925833.1 lincosamide and streptogramin A transport system ATP-binding/permease protein [Sedimentibacter acidaminivorans]